MADDERIAIDGVLDETAWARALPAKDFIQVDPANGSPATEPTEVRIVFTKDAIYMGVTCYDSEPDKWLGYQRRRDEFLPADDRFMWTIDTFLDERSGYFFEMNPSGLMADSLFGVNGDNRAWDGIWDARVVRSEIGWTIEIEIPFRTLNFDPDNDTWGFNFQRTVRRKNEDSIWMIGAKPGPQANDECRPRHWHSRGHARRRPRHQAVRATHIGVVEQSRRPAFARDRQRRNRPLLQPEPGVRANLTINTDFAQTEVDQRQINRRYRGQVYHGPRPQNHRSIRRTEYDANLEIVTHLRNQLLERLLNLTVFGVQLHSQDNFALEVDPSFVRLERPFTIFPGLTMPAGSEYHFTRFAFRGQTANLRMLALNGRFETGRSIRVTAIRQCSASRCGRDRATSSASTVSGIRSTLPRATSPRTCTAQRPTPSSLHSRRSSTSSSTTP
jgi:hypothetical protein